MLYVTTRNNQDAFPVHLALTDARAEEEGLYLPLRLPRFSQEDLEALKAQSFNQRLAVVLNRFFSTKLTAWDVDFAIGRFPVRLQSLGHRSLMGECWHNPDWSYHRLEENLASLLEGNVERPGNWTQIAIRTAVLFAVFGEWAGSGRVDIAMVCGDFSGPVGALYAREMGLPIGNVICCCNENTRLWDLLCHGQMRTDIEELASVVPEADIVVPANLERLIFACGGAAETWNYLAAVETGCVYTVGEEMRKRLKNGLFASVIGSSRIRSAIPNVWASQHRLLSPETALVYLGLQDYRVRTGVTRPALVISDQSPLCCMEAVAQAMDMTTEEARKLL